MAVLSRAELRRRERQRRKAVKREQIHRDIVMRYKDTDGGKAAVYADNGKCDGRALAFIFVAETLNERYGWGKDWIGEFLEKCNREAARYSEPGVRFAFEHYLEIVEYFTCRMKGLNTGRNIMESVYYLNRNTFFQSGMAVMITILFSDYGWRNNKEHTGKLDKVAEEAVKKFESMQKDADMNISKYLQELAEKTGFEFDNE